jgi:hypothetical protein
MSMDQNGITDPDKPPFFKRWRTFYWLVIAALVLQIILFYGITKYFE